MRGKFSFKESLKISTLIAKNRVTNCCICGEKKTEAIPAIVKITCRNINGKKHTTNKQQQYHQQQVNVYHWSQKSHCNSGVSMWVNECLCIRVCQLYGKGFTWIKEERRTKSPTCPRTTHPPDIELFWVEFVNKFKIKSVEHTFF